MCITRYKWKWIIIKKVNLQLSKRFDTYMKWIFVFFDIKPAVEIQSAAADIWRLQLFSCLTRADTLLAVFEVSACNL